MFALVDDVSDRSAAEKRQDVSLESWRIGVPLSQLNAVGVVWLSSIIILGLNDVKDPFRDSPNFSWSGVGSELPLIGGRDC